MSSNQRTRSARRFALLPLALLTAVLSAVACSPRAGTSPPAGEGTQGPSTGPVSREVDLSRFFPGIRAEDATFVLLDGSTGAMTRFNATRAGTGMLPASTFKIANAAIALETGVADGPDFLLPWDGRQTGSFWSPAWSRDHTLRSAMQTSAVWYYQELARRIGAERMQRQLTRFDYGNANIGGGIDQFWLTGELRISPDEQVRFLQRLLQEELGITSSTLSALRRILLLEETPEYRLSGKTGTVPLTPTRHMAWLIGYVERSDGTWYYALNVEGEAVWAQWGAPSARIALVREILRTLDIIPGGAPTG